MASLNAEDVEFAASVCVRHCFKLKGHFNFCGFYCASHGNFKFCFVEGAQVAIVTFKINGGGTFEFLKKRIGIGEARLQSILVKLQQWQLVKFENGIYKAKDPKMHLPEDSPIFLTFGILNRIKSIEKIRQVKPDESNDYFFSAVFSAEAKYQLKLKRKILDFLKETQGEVLKSKSEEVYQFNIDFFKWS